MVTLDHRLIKKASWTSTATVFLLLSGFSVVLKHLSDSISPISCIADYSATIGNIFIGTTSVLLRYESRISL